MSVAGVRAAQDDSGDRQPGARAWIGLHWAVPLAMIAGALQAASLAPQPRAGVQVLAMALFLALLPAGRGAVGGRRAALLGLSFGWAWLLGSFWWLFVSMHRYGHLPAWLSAAAVALLAAGLSVFAAAAAWAWQLTRSGRVLPDALSWAAFWLLAELARGQWFTGFPWGAVGYSHVDGLLAAVAPWGGVYGVGAVAAFLAALLAGVSGRIACPSPGRPVDAGAGRRLVFSGAGLVALSVAFWLAPPVRGPSFTEASGTLSVTLLQGNVPQDEKFDWEHLPEVLGWYLRELSGARTDLVVAPETAIPLLPDQLPEALWPTLTTRFGQGRTHALVGVPLGSFERGYTNSVVGLAPGQAEYRYDKHHLVPFGEFIPTGFRWFVDMMRIPLGDFTRGPLVAPAFPVSGERVAPNVCYEDLFGEELAARFADAARAPTVLANLSNIGWFGQTVAVDQHLQISRMRSLELQRPMLRATNTGATVVIDHQGRVLHALAPHRRAVLVGQVQGRSGNTPFASWAGRWGLLPMWAGAGLVAVAGAWRTRRRRADDGFRP